MIDYIELYKLLNDDAFKQRLQVCFWVKAIEILRENPSTPHHAARFAWAEKTIKEQTDQATVRQAVVMCAGDPVIGSVGKAATDAQLQTAVGGLIDWAVV